MSIHSRGHSVFPIYHAQMYTMILNMEKCILGKRKHGKVYPRNKIDMFKRFWPHFLAYLLVLHICSLCSYVLYIRIIPLLNKDFVIQLALSSISRLAFCLHGFNDDFPSYYIHVVLHKLVQIIPCIHSLGCLFLVSYYLPCPHIIHLDFKSRTSPFRDQTYILCIAMSFCMTRSLCHAHTH